MQMFILFIYLLIYLLMKHRLYEIFTRFPPYISEHQNYAKHILNVHLRCTYIVFPLKSVATSIISEWKELSSLKWYLGIVKWPCATQ